MGRVKETMFVIGMFLLLGSGGTVDAGGSMIKAMSIGIVGLLLMIPMVTKEWR